MVSINAMRVQLELAALENSVFMNGQANMAAGTCLINTGIQSTLYYFLPIANYSQFILNRYQVVDQKPEYTVTP